MEHLGFFQFFHRHAPFLFVHCSGPYLHPNKFYSSTQLSAALHFAGRFAGSPSVFCSLWPLFGETFQMRKEQTPWHCLFWCFRKYSQMKWWNEWNQGCPISCRCPGTRSLAFLWGAVHLGKCKCTTILKLIIFTYQSLILFWLGLLIFILPESVSTDIVGCVSIADESIGSYQISASVSPGKDFLKKLNKSAFWGHRCVLFSTVIKSYWYSVGPAHHTLYGEFQHF